MRSMADVIEVRVHLEGEMVRRFLLLKRKLGLENNTDLLRMIITKAYEQECLREND